MTSESATLQSPAESPEAIPETSSSSSSAESSSSNSSSSSSDNDDNDDDFHKEQLSNKLVQEAKRTSRLSQVTSPGDEDSNGSLEGDETSAEAVVQRYMERVS